VVLPGKHLLAFVGSSVGGLFVIFFCMRYMHFFVVLFLSGWSD
jgi:predicted alpha/beta superfamily hydrolase